MSSALPFTIDKTSRTSLTDQLTAGFASAIRCGVYRKGQTLPTIAEISRLSGVSQIVTRHAIAKLADAGLVVTRQFHGIEVLGANSPPRKGHVLIVTAELRDNFFVASVSAVLRETLAKAGYITTPVYAVHSAIDDSRMDFAQLDAMLDLPIRLAVVLLDRWGIGSHIVASGKTPLVVLGYTPVKGAEGFICFSDAQAKADFAAHCAAAGIRSVMEIVMTGGVPGCGALLREAGVGYEVWDIESAEAEDAIEMVQRGALEAFERRLSAGRDWLPDLLLFSDDYAAAGEVALDAACLADWAACADEARKTRKGGVVLDLPRRDGADAYGDCGWLQTKARRGVPQATRFKLWRGNDALHLLADCEEDDPGFARGTDRHDDYDWTGQSIEIFIDAGDGLCRQIAVTPAGGVWDASDGDKTWDSGATARPEIAKGRWTLDIAIPYGPLGGAPKVGDRWEFMAIRNGSGKYASCGWPIDAHRDFTSAATLVFK